MSEPHSPTSTVKTNRSSSARKLPKWLRLTKRSNRTWIGELLSDEILLHIASLIRLPTSVSKFKTSCRRCTSALPAPTCDQCAATEHVILCHICEELLTCLEHAYSCESCGSVACTACVPTKCAGCAMHLCGMCSICNCN